MYNRLILTGAGIRGIAYLGVIKNMETQETIESIGSYIGVSIGAVVCLGLVLGYNSDELRDIFSKLKMNEKYVSILNLFKNYGVHNCNDIMGVVTKAIKKKE
jgi:predicted acylesterase/phospholipase RssA